MSTAVIELVKQAENLSPAETLELVMALLQRTRNVVDTSKSPLKWSDIRGIYPYPMFGEDAQIAIHRMREEWDEREKQWSQPE